jgi:hypothetical protein
VCVYISGMKYNEIEWNLYYLIPSHLYNVIILYLFLSKCAAKGEPLQQPYRLK